jgi:hypothetical protein
MLELLEQDFEHQRECDNISPKETAGISSSIIDQYDNVNFPPLSMSGQKSLEDRETNAFLESEYKKKVSDEIKQHNKEKKLYVNWLIRCYFWIFMLTTVEIYSKHVSDLKNPGHKIPLIILMILTIGLTKSYSECKTVTKCLDQNSGLGDSDTETLKIEESNSRRFGAGADLLCI